MAQTVNHRMGGTGVTDAMEKQIQAFIGYQPLPDNPFKTDVLTPAQQRGAAAFVKAQCGTCHLGQALTDNVFHLVGTQVANAADGVDDNLARLVHGGFNTPSLIGLARTAPYLHDGSAQTLMDRVSNDEGGQHGVTSSLTDQEKGDLVEYLKTL
jgi:cytochrome c peroxidase